MGLRKAASQLLLHRPTSICTCLLLKNNTLLDLLKILSFVWWFVQNQVKSFTDNLVQKKYFVDQTCFKKSEMNRNGIDTNVDIYRSTHISTSTKEYYTCKINAHPTRDLESLYTCVHASSLHRIDSLLHCICLLSKEVQIVLTGIKLSNQYLLKTEKVLNYWSE